jgi:hypothetical protein
MQAEMVDPATATHPTAREQHRVGVRLLKGVENAAADIDERAAFPDRLVVA